MINKRNDKSNFLSALLKKLAKKPRILLNFGRPEELPPYAPDCGWNHSEKKKETKEENPFEGELLQ